MVLYDNMSVALAERILIYKVYPQNKHIGTNNDEKISPKATTPLEGWKNHPKIAFAWSLFNMPSSVLVSDGLAKLYHSGTIEKRSKNIRRVAIFRLFGPWGLKAVHDHFDHFDVKEMREEMRMFNRWKKMETSLDDEFLKPSPVFAALELTKAQLFLLPDAENKTLALPMSIGETLQMMSEESDKTNLLTVVFPQTDQLSINGNRATLVKNLGRRLVVLAAIQRNLCDRLVRSKSSGGDEYRVLIFDKTAETMRNLASRRMRPTVALEEMSALEEMFKMALVLERAPKALLSMTNWAKSLLLGSLDFIDRELKEPFYQGKIQFDRLAQSVYDMAWSFVCLSRRGIQVNHGWVKADLLAEIEDKLNDPLLGEEAKKIAKKACSILALAHRNDLPMLGRDSLKPLIGVSMFSDIFSIGENKGEEIVINLENGLTLNRGGNCTKQELLQIIKWFSLRFPFNDDIVVQEGDGTRRIILAGKVREDLVVGRLDYFPYSYLAQDSVSCKNEDYQLTKLKSLPH